tara:strand:- start:382 stop:1260 length:879 start_codon:yes stop_codon:yes gene_type:complete
MSLSKTNQKIILSALTEDEAKADISSKLAIGSSLRGVAIIIAKDCGCFCGREVAKFIFKSVDKRLQFLTSKRDGQKIKTGDLVCKIKGNLRSILRAERLVLNFLSLLSGVSTDTSKYVAKVKGLKVKILDTRKTTPNLRQLQKYAVAVGGGLNHRFSLADAILIKDNHLSAGGYVVKGKLSREKLEKLITKIRKTTKQTIEIEVENLNQFKIVAKNKPDIIMLDNFSCVSLREAVKLRNKYYPGILLEASGGINLNSVEKIARTGVDRISVGAITHSVKAIDFSLEIQSPTN